MHPQELLSAALARHDIESARQSIDAWAEHVRVADVDEMEPFQEMLLSLSTHAEPKIRQAVAGVTDVLPDRAFDALLEPLSADLDPYVRAAMERAARRRAGRRKATLKESERESLVARLLGDMERRYGKGARKLADQIARRNTEFFVRKLHHEVVKIFTPLEFSLNEILTQLDEPEVNRAILREHITVALERLGFLWAILDRARTATATIVPRFTRTPLLPLVDTARAHLVDRMGPRADRLRVSLEIDPALQMDLDRAGFLQAVQNFLQNAVEAYPPDAPTLDVGIAVHTRRAASLVEILISDQGQGLSEERLRNHYTPFGSRKPGGTGVGLLIARTMVEEVHGGTLEFDSAPGRGTTVRVTLPARQIPAAQP